MNLLTLPTPAPTPYAVRPGPRLDRNGRPLPEVRRVELGTGGSGLKNVTLLPMGKLRC